MKHLVEGYLKFKADVFPHRKEQFKLLADRQSPHSLFITCSDSRIVPDLMLQSQPGDLFIIRNAGNVVPPNGDLAGGVSATIEYAVQALKVKHVIICGHSDCGAVKAVSNKMDLTGLPLVAEWLRYVEAAWKYSAPGSPGADEKSRHTALIHANIIAQLQNLKTQPAVERGLADGALDVHGWYYDIMNGTIDEYDETSDSFLPLDAKLKAGPGSFLPFELS